MTQVSVIRPADGEVIQLGPVQMRCRYATVPATEFAQETS